MYLLSLYYFSCVFCKWLQWKLTVLTLSFLQLNFDSSQGAILLVNSSAASCDLRWYCLLTFLQLNTIMGSREMKASLSFRVGAVSWWIRSPVRVVTSSRQFYFASDYKNIFKEDLPVFTDDAFMVYSIILRICFSWLLKTLQALSCEGEMTSPYPLYPIFPK